MSRRRGDEPLAGRESVEIIESETRGAGATEVVRTGRGVSRAFGIALAAMATLAILVLAVTSTSEQDATPPTSTDPEAASGPTDPVAAPEALLGRGPNIEWEQIIWNIRTSDFRWIDGAFVGDNGETEWSIRPTMIDTAVQQRQSLQLSYPEYDQVPADGVRVLAPRLDQADHLLFFPSDDDGLRPVRVDLPTRAPVTDLITRRSVIQAAAVDDDAVVVIERIDRVNPETLGPRLGVDLIGRQPTVRSTDGELQIVVSPTEADQSEDTISLALDDLDLSATELEALRPRASQLEVLAVDLVSGTTGPPGIVPDGRADLGVAGDRFVLSWDNGDVAEHVSTSRTGRSWQPSASRVGITNSSGDTTSIVGIEQATGAIARSGNGATSWQYTTAPVSPFDLTVARDYVAVWQPKTRPNGLDQDDQDAVPDRSAEPVPLVGFARWDGGQPPVWRLESLDAVFGPTAVGVEFFTGGGHLLAVVTTERGFTFHIADVR